MADVHELQDDIDGRTRAGVVRTTFGIGPDHYEIDLKPSNMNRLRKDMEPFIDAGRRVQANGGYRFGRTRGAGVRPGQVRRRDGRTPVARKDSAEKREWARANGWPMISNRGRMPKEAEQAWFEHQQSLNGANGAGDSETP